MTDKKKERIKRRMERFAKRETKRQWKYAGKVVKMTQAERDAELAKCERKIAKYESETWRRRMSLRFAGSVILASFVVIYAVLWFTGVSLRSFWGAFAVVFITFVFLTMLASFMDTYRSVGKDDDDSEKSA